MSKITSGKYQTLKSGDLDLGASMNRVRSSCNFKAGLPLMNKVNIS